MLWDFYRSSPVTGSKAVKLAHGGYVPSYLGCGPTMMQALKMHIRQALRCNAAGRGRTEADRGSS